MSKTTKKTVRADKKTVAKKEVKAVKKEVEAAPVVEEDTGENLYLLMAGQKHQFKSQISTIYDVKEFYYRGVLLEGAAIKLVRGDGSEVPVHHAANCGYTLIGKAQQYFKASKALCANGEACDDQEYVYINEHSTLTYIGETGEHTLYVRIYDNLTGENNDRWVVLYLD